MYVVADVLQFLLSVIGTEDDPDFIDSDNELSTGEDDWLFDNNVTEGIEVGCDGGAPEQELVVQEKNDDVDDLECPSSEELLSVVSSDDEVGYRFSEFVAETDMRDPQLHIGQLFSSIQEFRKAVRTYGAVNGYNVKCKVNDDSRVQAICKSDCQWRIWASKMNNSDRVQVKSYMHQHTCSRDQYNRHCNYMFIVHRYIEQFKADPEWKTKSMQATIKADLKINITRNVAWKARRYAKQLINGTIEEQFGSLRSYAAEVLRTNPGSTVRIALSGQVFQGVYICFNACKLGFRNGCRKFIGVDGCHLRGVWGGIMLTAVGLDANDCIYPVSYAVVEKENTTAWRWFLKYLAEDIQMENGRNWTVMTDRQKGLSNVIDELFPESEHRFCVRHMYTNFFDKGFKGKTLKDLLWRAAKSTTVPDFRYWMEQIRQLNEAAYNWLMERHPSEWSKSHFRTHSKSDMLLNNLCEVFNKMLIDEREKFITAMLKDMQLGFMSRIEKRRSKMRLCGGRLCPRIKKRLAQIAEMSNECSLHFSGGPRWQVDYRSDSYVVDLEERSCACRRWDLTGIPCTHAVAVIRECRNDPEDYVANWYTVDTYLRCYDNILNPINGIRLWPQLDTLPILPPSWMIPQRGRKQKKRRRQADEDVIASSQGKSLVTRKGRVSMTCSICNLKGHNKRYHSKPDAPSDVSS